MGLRTEDSIVRDIIDVDPSLDITGFMESANVLVDYVDSEDTDGVLSAQHLERIERWLSAHFIAHRDQLFEEKKTGDATARFQGKTAMYLDSTQYGQTAKVLDVTGTLARLDKQAKEGKKVATVDWMGREPENQDWNTGNS